MADIKELHRVTVNFIPKAWEAVEKTAEREGLNKTDTINRAVQLYDFVSGIVAAGGEVHIRESGGKELQRVKLI